jgi:hypothetical protein
LLKFLLSVQSTNLLIKRASMRIRSLALCFAALPSTVLALGFRVVDHGAEATAKGGAFAATADNPTACVP